jgi:hypothetical protein
MAPQPCSPRWTSLASPAGDAGDGVASEEPTDPPQPRRSLDRSGLDLLVRVYGLLQIAERHRRLTLRPGMSAV